MSEQKEFVLVKCFGGEEIESFAFDSFEEANKEFEEFTGINYEFFSTLKECFPALIEDFTGSNIIECEARVIE